MKFVLEAQRLIPMSTAQARPNDGRGPLCETGNGGDLNRHHRTKLRRL
jgi:hypothetical protein